MDTDRDPIGTLARTWGVERADLIAQAEIFREGRAGDIADADIAERFRAWYEGEQGAELAAMRLFPSGPPSIAQILHAMTLYREPRVFIALLAHKGAESTAGRAAVLGFVNHATAAWVLRVESERRLLTEALGRVRRSSGRDAAEVKLRAQFEQEADALGRSRSQASVSWFAEASSMWDEAIDWRQVAEHFLAKARES